MAGALPENAAAARQQLAGGRPALVWRRLVADTETPVGAALKLIEPGRGDFLLESVEGGEVRGRYSLLGLDPDLVFRATGHACEVNRGWRHDRADLYDLFFEAPRQLVLRRHRLEISERVAHDGTIEHKVDAGEVADRIAERLAISEETVKAHMKNVLAKLAANDRTHAVTIALKRGIITI